MKTTRAWFALDSNIKIETIGLVQRTEPHPTRQGVPYWILVLVEKGKRTLYADQKPLQIDAHQFFLLPPFTEQKPFLVDEHSAFYIHFFAHGKEIESPVRVNAAQIKLPSYGYLPSNFDCFSYLRYLNDHAMSPYADADFMAQQLQAFLMILSLQCQKMPHWKEQKGFPIDDLLSFIKENACHPMRAEDYEEAFGKSYHHINQLFKKQFGATIKQYHTQIRMQYAAQMLLSGLSIQETATKCGFEDYFFFINSFTKEHGISPTAYRKRHGG